MCVSADGFYHGSSDRVGIYVVAFALIWLICDAASQLIVNTLFGILERRVLKDTRQGLGYFWQTTARTDLVFKTQCLTHLEQANSVS